MSTDLRSPGLLSPTDRVAAAGLLLAALVTSAGSLPVLFTHGSNSGQFIGTYSLQWVALLGIVILATGVELALLLLLALGRESHLFRAPRQLVSAVSQLNKPLLLIIYTLPWLFYVGVVLYRLQTNLPTFFPRLWIFLLMAALGAAFLSAHTRGLTYFWALMVTFILYGVAVKALGYLPEVSAYPFSLGWSEASRYYYASLPFARSLYGMDIPLSPWHPSRYFLQGLAFLLSDSAIWLHRLWQVVLWLGMPLLTGWALVRRFHLAKPAALLLVLWSALFLLQGPVYYHLLVCVILVLWGFDSRRFWKTLLFVTLASLWAGISRVNWIPVPAFLAAALYFLEVPTSASRAWLRYLLPPVAWGVAGGLAALASQAAYVLVSGHEDAAAFGSVFTSALLWYRLLPNPTYPMGVVPAIILVSLPLLLLIVFTTLSLRRVLHPIRLLGLGAMALILFAGGLVVSTKIGGGSNIHNLDAFLTLLWITGVSVGLGCFVSEAGLALPAWRPWPLLLALIAVPVIWNINIVPPFVDRNMVQAKIDLGKLSAYAQDYASRGEVLFITQRQLLVFGMIPGVKLVTEYELLTLSEMAISNNQAYLDRFDRDLADGRFRLIVMDYQSGQVKDPEFDSFSEENNAWRDKIAAPLNRYYKKLTLLDTQGIQLYIPRQEDAESK